MSFKLIIIVIVLAGCGVKGPPNPQSQNIPSVLEVDYPELNVPPASLPGD